MIGVKPLSRESAGKISACMLSDFWWAWLRTTMLCILLVISAVNFIFGLGFLSQKETDDQGSENVG